VGQHFKLPVTLLKTKGEIEKVALSYLVDEELLPEQALEGTSVGGEQGLELKRLEYQEKDKASN